MTTYDSIDKIKQDFAINSDDLDTIRESLNKIRIDNHPDRTNGEFKNDLRKDMYHNANSAIEYIDRLKNNHSLVIVDKMTDLMKIISDLIPNNKQISLEHNLDLKITNAISIFRSKQFLPKISLTALTSIVTFVFLFPKQIKENPTLSYYIDPSNSVFRIVWLALLTYSCLFWILTYSNEQKAKRKLTLLKVDSTQNELFEDFIRFKMREDIFSKDELTQYIYVNSTGMNQYSPVFITFIRRIIYGLFGSEIITLEIAQNIAELIIDRANKINIISKVESTTLDEKYKLKNYKKNRFNEL